MTLRFTEGNPAIEEFDRTTQNRQAQRRERYQQAATENTDRALRSVVADSESERARAVAQGGAGTGGAAYEMAETDRARRDEDTRTALEALALGDMQTFDYYGGRSGIREQIPDEALRNAELRQRIGVGGMVADKFYGGDDEQAAEFMRIYTETGDLDAATQAVGPPRRAPDVSIQTIMQGGKRVKAYVDRANQRIVGIVGEAPPAGGGGAGGTGAMEDVGRIDRNTAMNYISGLTVTQSGEAPGTTAEVPLFGPGEQVAAAEAYLQWQNGGDPTAWNALLARKGLTDPNASGGAAQGGGEQAAPAAGGTDYVTGGAANPPQRMRFDENGNPVE